LDKSTGIPLGGGFCHGMGWVRVDRSSLTFSEGEGVRICVTVEGIS
jgi:hypothetical protein